MHSQRVRILSRVLIALVTLPLIISIVWKPSISFADYAAQGALILVTIVTPFLSFTFKKAFGLPFLLAFLWGVWRFSYFDPVTSNDIPGIGYLFPPFAFGFISVVIFGVKLWFQRLV